jgi:hypothetical protein
LKFAGFELIAQNRTLAGAVGIGVGSAVGGSRRRSSRSTANDETRSRPVRQCRRAVHQRRSQANFSVLSAVLGALAGDAVLIAPVSTQIPC